jgi:hypothetical protein
VRIDCGNDHDYNCGNYHDYNCDNYHDYDRNCDNYHHRNCDRDSNYDHDHRRVTENSNRDRRDEKATLKYLPPKSASERR